MVVYLDVLIILNLYINFFLIKTAALFLKRKISRKRSILAALLGAFGSIIILAPTLPLFVTIPYKIVLGGGIVLIAFGKQKIRDYLVCVLFFLLAGFLFGGIISAIWTIFSPAGMLLNNGICFFNIPIGALAAFTAGAYFLMKLVKMLSDKRKRRICTVKVARNGKEILLRGLCDTGCEVRDVFSGKPVVICDLEKTAAVIPDEVSDFLAGKLDALVKIRLIPCSTVSGSAAIPVFKADVLVDGKYADALVGVSKTRLGDDVDCIFNPNIIPN